MITINH